MKDVLIYSEVIKNINIEKIKKKILARENCYFLTIILIAFFLDRYSKSLIIKYFSENTYFINNFVNLDLVWNTGIGFGLLSSNSVFLYNLISAVILLVIIYLIIIGLNSDKLGKLMFSLIVGGATGNFYDRATFRAVPDFIDLHYNNFHWFTFNIADIFITVGVLIFLFKSPFYKNEKN